MRRGLAPAIAGICLALATGAAVTPALGAPGPADWPAYNRTLEGDRFSPLAQIRRSNVGRLRLVCSYQLPEVVAFQTGPLVVAGTMYFTTGTGSYAIDAASCRVKWVRGRAHAGSGRPGVNRGFAYLDGRLFRGTADGHVVALAAADGHPLWDRRLAVQPGMSFPMAPIAADGRVYIGNAGGDNVGVTGHVYALDARDGHVLWHLDVVPAGPARASWTNPALPISGGAFWTSFTLDSSKGILYVPAGNPAPDFDTRDRTGDDLYSDSVIAIDAASGRMLAYNQLVKHDSHDWDVDSPPTLVTTRAGHRIIASANKDGLLSILDRSGVQAGTGSAPQTAPPLIPLLSQTPTTTRSNVEVPLASDHAVHFCPGFTGGTEWNGAAYSPQTDSLFVAAVDYCSRVQLQQPLRIPPPGQIWFATATPAAQRFDPASQARGWLTAFNAENGAVRWKFKAARPMLAGVTPTAGGIVFAADLGGTVYALDQRTGRLLWHTDTGQSIGGGIVTYRAAGHQLLAVASGMNSPIWPGGAKQSRILVYGLP